MKQLFLLAAALGIAGCLGEAPKPAVAAPAPPGHSAPRAIWIWEDDTFRLLENESIRRTTFDFLTERKVSTLYLYADSYQGKNILVSEPAKYRAFIKKAHECGFKVQALLGSAYLRTQEYILPEKREPALRMFQAIIDFNKSSPGESKFDGVNVDIEPHLLPDWKERRTERSLQFLDLAAAFMEMKRESGETLAVGPAMPFWFDGIEITWRDQTKMLSEHAQEIFDYVALMDYRNLAHGSDGIISHARDELVYADKIGREVVVGVETGRSSPAKVTFHGKKLAVMEGELEKAESEFRKHESFAGFAIHHLSTYRAMKNTNN